MTLLKKFPAPWSIIDELGGKAYSVLDANDVPIYYSGTYTGDGDEEILLTKEDWAEIVKIVNREVQS